MTDKHTKLSVTNQTENVVKLKTHIMPPYILKDYGKGSLFLEEECGSVICEFPEYAIDRLQCAEFVHSACNTYYERDALISELVDAMDCLTDYYNTSSYRDLIKKAHTLLPALKKGETR